MKIYFGGSIRGGRDDAELYMQMIEATRQYGTVLTEHLGDKTLSALDGEAKLQVTDSYIFERDYAWVKEADALVMEVSTPSLGVGYELGLADALEKPILCLYREQEGRRLSAMVDGNARNVVRRYKTLEEVEVILKEFFMNR